MRAVRASALLVSICAISSVAVAQRATPRRDATVPFAVGETLTYDVTWSTYLVAGSATATVVDRQASPNGAAYHVVAEGRPIPLLARLYNMYYRMETLIDSVTLLPRRGTLYSEEGGRKATSITEFDRTAGRARYELQAEAGGKVEFPIPPQAQDGLSTLYVIRAMPFKTGQSITLPVSDSGAMYTVKADVGPLERITVPLGEREAWNVAISVVDENNQPVTKNGALWISNDARRLPLKLQGELPVGYFVLLLREAR
jgi:hypothetical protein